MEKRQAMLYDQSDFLAQSDFGMHKHSKMVIFMPVSFGGICNLLHGYSTYNNNFGESSLHGAVKTEARKQWVWEHLGGKEGGDT